MLFLTDVGHGCYEKGKIDTAAILLYAAVDYTVLGRRWFRIDEKKRRL